VAATDERGADHYLLNRREMRLGTELLDRLCAAEPEAVALSSGDGTRVRCR
jgi:hypothetical protein